MGKAEFPVGTAIGGYKVERVEPLEHLKGTYYELTHDQTGAKHIHVATPDDNKGFAVVVPTVPKDSTGVAHILEHLALAGSEKFPVKDPFFSMTTRSLNTFMNASTSDDATVYLFSTRNEKDYYNLASVYLDATFFPKLRELSFKQEGHRLEFETADDPSSTLQFKGVVFNEMKGYMATPLFTMREAIGSALYPDLTYAVNAGGAPEDIPNLTYENLKKFHETHYHPSTAFFVSYGNAPLDKIVGLVEQNVLSRFERKPRADVDIPDTKRFDKPQEYRESYPLSKEEDAAKKALVQIGWGTTVSTDSFEVLSLKVLEKVLIGNPASPLRKALIDSGLGEALDNFSRFNTDYREAVFSAGLKGTSQENAEKIEALVLETLETLVKDGVDPTLVDAAIHQLEIEAREISDRPFPYAIRVIYDVAPALTHGGDPYARLQFDPDLDRLNEERKSGGFFENLIRRWLLDNPHRSRIIVFPDQDLEERRRTDEAARLAKIASGLSDADKTKIVEESALLKKHQEDKGDVDSLPTLELSDIPMRFEDVTHTIEEIGGAKVGLFPQPTNGLAYVDVRADFSGLPDALKSRLGLFSYTVTKMGAAGLDYSAMARRIDAFTGGIQAGSSVRVTAKGGDDSLQSFILSGKALTRNNKAFVEILKDFLTAVEWDPKRVKELISEQKAQYDSFVVLAGTQFAMQLAASQVSPAMGIQERIGGLSQYTLLRELISDLDGKIEGVIADLDAIRQYLFTSAGLQICVTSDEESLPELKSLLQDLLSALPERTAAVDGAVPAAGKIVNFARTIAAPVNYNVKVVRTADYTHPDAPALMVLGNYLSDKYFLRELREKRGAYGAGSAFQREGGLFLFYTSQDPNLSKTFETFDLGVKEVAVNGISAVDLKEAILASCQAVDPLQSPDTKGRTRFFGDLAGYTLSVQEKFKKGLLDVTADDVKRVASTHFADGKTAMASLCNPDMIKTANEELGGVFEVAAV